MKVSRFSSITELIRQPCRLAIESGRSNASPRTPRLSGRSLASLRPAVIPPREHTERERLAMRPEIRGDLGPLIDDLHALLERHLTVAKQASSARCGICYLHFATAELDYREIDGFYVCPACNQDLRGQPLPMIRRQPR